MWLSLVLWCARPWEAQSLVSVARWAQHKKRVAPTRLQSSSSFRELDDDDDDDRSLQEELASRVRNTEFRLDSFPELDDDDAATKDSSTKELFEVELARPLGITVQSAKDGAAYVTASRGNALEAGIVAGDVVVGVSGIFGDEIWDVTGQGVEKVQALIRNRPSDAVRLRVERGHAYHLASVEEDVYGDDIDTLTMKSIFNFENENQAIRRAAPEGVTKNGQRQRTTAITTAKEEETMDAFFRKLEEVLQEENPVVVQNDEDDDPKKKTTTREAAVETFVTAAEYGSGEDYASGGPVIEDRRPRTTIDGDFGNFDNIS